VKELHLTEEMWQIIREVNTYWNYKIKYLSDTEAWGVPEKWSMPKEIDGELRDDCDSYSIAKQDTLKKNHNIESYLALCQVEASAGSGYHLVCIIHTDRGAYVLDNRFPMVFHYKDCGYKWHKIEMEDGTWQNFS